MPFYLTLIISFLLGMPTANAPTLTPAAGTYSTTQTVTVRALTSGAINRCTFDGSDPSLLTPRYQSPFQVSSSTTVKCRTWVRDHNPSPVTTAIYTIASTCTSWTYTAWGSCQPNGMQARSIVTSSPASCVGGSPVLSQACTYIASDPSTPAEFYSRASATCAAMPIRTTGTKYYFCDCEAGSQPGCVAGNDSNSGTSASSPKRSFAASTAVFENMNAGDTIAYCKGGVWPKSTSTQRLLNTKCRADPGGIKVENSTYLCDIRDYAPAWGGTNKPVLQLQTPNSLFGGWAFWYYLAAHMEGLRFFNLEYRGGNLPYPNNTTGGDVLFAFFGDITDVLICNNKIDGYNMPMDIAPDSNDTTRRPKRFTIWGNTITNGTGVGAILGGAEDLAFDANLLIDNVGVNNRDHSTYLSGGTNTQFVNNEIRLVNRAGLDGVLAVFHGEHNGLNIENNIFDGGPNPGGGAWGIAVDPGYAELEYFTDVTIRRNTILNVGNAAIATGDSPGIIIENNKIRMSRYGGIGINLNWRVGTQYGNPVGNNPKIRNNTIYFDSAYSSGSTGIRAADNPLTGAVIANNSVYFAGSGGTCFITTLSSGSFTFIGNNACYGTGSSWGTTYDSTTHLTSNPLFTNAPADLTPLVGSPLGGAGNNTHKAATDFNLKVRPNPPAIGAVEPASVVTCTSWTYSSWGACQSDSTQTRTILTSSPSGCTGGSPVTSQACTYALPVAASSCAVEPMRTTGTTYYVCDCQTGSEAGCVQGNDASAGTSPATAWRSWSKGVTQFNTMVAGSTVAFCKGGAWTGLTSVISEMRNQNCRADSATRPPQAGDSQTCDMRDYQASWGGTNKPLLKFAANQKFLQMGWYEDTNGGWDATKVTGVRVLNLDLVANGDGTSGAFNIWGRVHNLEICNNTFRDGWNNAYAGSTTMTVKYVNFHHNRVTNNPFGIGIVSGTSCIKDCWFDSNYFDLNGGSNNRDHTIYAGGAPYEGTNWPTDPDVGPQSQICQGIYQSTSHMCYAVSKGSRITNNEIRRSARGTGSNCVGSAIVVHGPHDGLLIENNLIYEPFGTAWPGCYGIDQTAGIDMPGAWTNTIIRRNQIYNVEANAIRTGNCQGCVIENNYIYGGSMGIQAPDPGNRCTSVAYPPTALYTCSGNLEDSGTIVRNNTVMSGGNIDLNNYSNPGSVAANNVVCGGSLDPATTTASTTVAGNRVAASSCAAWFEAATLDPTTNDIRPREGSVLIGAGSATSVGTRFQDGVGWSASNPGVAPDSPPTQGAAVRALMTTASRTSGVAPLGVVFDAVDTVNTGTDQPFTWTSGVMQPLDREGSTYSWNFGDSYASSGVMSGGIQMDKATGYVAAHVYQTPGTFTATLTVTDTTGVTTSYAQTITVTAFSGTTYYVSGGYPTGSDSNDGLSESTPFLTAAKGFSMAGTNTRILFRRGYTYSMPNAVNITAPGPGIIGAYGLGPDPLNNGVRPILTTTATSEPHLMVGSDWRVMDIQLIGPANATTGTGLGLDVQTKRTFPLFHRVYVQGWWVGIGWSEWAQTLTDPHEGVVISECETNAGGYGMYIGGRRLAVIGGYHHDAYQTHLIRMYAAHKGVIFNNALYNPGPTRHAIKLASHGTGSNNYWTRYVSISDNRVRGKVWSVAIAPEDEGSDERVNNVVVERNKFVGEASIQTDLYISASDVMVRNNVLNGTASYYGYTGVRVVKRGIVPASTNVRVLNNSILRTDTTSGGQPTQITGVSVEATSVDTAVRNNLVYSPVAGGTAVSGTGTNSTISNNIFTTSNPFINATGSGGVFNFSLGSSIGGGAVLPDVRFDFIGTRRSPPYDVGAYER